MEAINIEFVGEVQKYPQLYDYTKPSYSRKDIVEKAWAEVGKKFNLTGQESKEKWRNLRNTFVKNLKPPPNGSSARKRKTYYLSEAMQFTLPFVKVSGISSRGELVEIPSPEGSTADESEAPLDQPEIIFSKRNSLRPPSLSPPPSLPSNSNPLLSSLSSSVGLSHGRQLLNKRKRGPTTWVDADKHIAEYFLAKKKYVEAKQQVANISGLSPQSEALKMFLLSLIPDIEALPPTKIRTFKRRTLAIIEELSDSDTNMSSAPSTDPQCNTLYFDPPVLRTSIMAPRLPVVSANQTESDRGEPFFIKVEP